MAVNKTWTHSHSGFSGPGFYTELDCPNATSVVTNELPFKMPGAPVMIMLASTDGAAFASTLRVYLEGKFIKCVSDSSYTTKEVWKKLVVCMSNSNSAEQTTYKNFGNMPAMGYRFKINSATDVSADDASISLAVLAPTGSAQ